MVNKTITLNGVTIITNHLNIINYNTKDICPYNQLGKKHGYWERYHLNGEDWYKGRYNNDEPFGLWKIKKQYGFIHIFIIKF